MHQTSKVSNELSQEEELELALKELEVFEQFDRTLRQFKHPYTPKLGYLPIVQLLHCANDNGEVAIYQSLVILFDYWARVDREDFTRVDADYLAWLELKLVTGYRDYFERQGFPVEDRITNRPSSRAY